MKDIFPGYNRKSEKDIKKIWEKGIIMFDANVLLNLYRYSNATRKTILDLIEKFQDKIWLPHQSALEYNRNRYEVIADQEKAYKEFTEKITQIQKDLQSSSKPPFLSKSVHKDLNKVFENVNSEVADSIGKYCDYLKEDPIYKSLSELFKSKITEPFSDDELEDVFNEGVERFKSKIPPGFEDEKIKDGNRKYGDLILWKQIIYKAKKEKKSVIFITDERKKDWWWKIKDGRNMGPRQELTEEIKRIANVDFHMYSSERFLSYGQEFLKEQVSQAALEEIKAMKKSEMEHLRKISRINERNFKREILAKNEYEYLRHKKRELKGSIYKNLRQREELQHDAFENGENQEYIHNLDIQNSELSNELNMLNNQMDNIRMNDLDAREQRREVLKERNLFKHFSRGKKPDNEKN